MHHLRLVWEVIESWFKRSILVQLDEVDPILPGDTVRNDVEVPVGVYSGFDLGRLELKVEVYLFGGLKVHENRVALRAWNEADGL